MRFSKDDLIQVWCREHKMAVDGDLRLDYKGGCHWKFDTSHMECWTGSERTTKHGCEDTWEVRVTR